MFIVGGDQGVMLRRCKERRYRTILRLLLKAPMSWWIFALLLSGLIFTGHFVGGGNLRILVSN